MDLSASYSGRNDRSSYLVCPGQRRIRINAPHSRARGLGREPSLVTLDGDHPRQPRQRSFDRRCHMGDQISVVRSGHPVHPGARRRQISDMLRGTPPSRGAVDGAARRGERAGARPGVPGVAARAGRLSSPGDYAYLETSAHTLLTLARLPHGLAAKAERETLPLHSSNSSRAAALRRKAKTETSVPTVTSPTVSRTPQ